MVLGFIGVGIVIGAILAWVLSNILRSGVSDRASASREADYNFELKRLEKENERLRRKISKYFEEEE